MTTLLERPPTPSDAPMVFTQPFPMAQQDNDVCCGPASLPPSSTDARAGYRIEPFVAKFLATAAGPVPQLRSTPDWWDHWGTIRVRVGIDRNNYSIAPGLYAMGNPDKAAPVLVTCNYKLTVDVLRRQIGTLDLWLLVIDSRGINVWCAAGKGTFGTEEVIQRVNGSGIDKLVDHRRLILPQLGATGVRGRDVKKQTGFEVVWGPVRAQDIPRFLDNKCKADEDMRRVSFTLKERTELIPVELSFLPKPTLWIIVAALVLSAIGPQWISLSAGWFRGLLLLGGYGIGIIAGAVLTPTLLPWVPGRAFAFKGILCGIVSAGLMVWPLKNLLNTWEMSAILLFATAVSSYLAMNYTGTTPFTSPSGVEKEMRRYMPIQAMAVLVAAGLWISGAFAA